MDTGRGLLLAVQITKSKYGILSLENVLYVLGLALSWSFFRLTSVYHRRLCKATPDVSGHSSLKETELFLGQMIKLSRFGMRTREHAPKRCRGIWTSCVSYFLFLTSRLVVWRIGTRTALDACNLMQIKSWADPTIGQLNCGISTRANASIHLRVILVSSLLSAGVCYVVCVSMVFQQTLFEGKVWWCLF